MPRIRNRVRIIFVTGTDTGVGKTFLTAVLLAHLRRAGCHALAMKPFCSGGTSDVDLLWELQGGELTREEVNPFYYAQPIAPYVAARARRGPVVMLNTARDAVLRTAEKCDVLLVEGSGGLLVPLGPGTGAGPYTVREFIKSLRCEVLVASRNALGTINHTCLTMEALHGKSLVRSSIVMMGQPRNDTSSDSNVTTLRRMLPKERVFEVPFVRMKFPRAVRLKKIATKLQKLLAGLLGGL